MNTKQLVELGRELGLSDEQIFEKMANAVSSKKKATKKTSINGASKDVVPEIEEADGNLVFKAKGYKVGRKSGYPKADIVKAEKLFEAKRYSGENRVTGTKFVLVGTSPIGENLVIHAKENGFLG